MRSKAKEKKYYKPARTPKEKALRVLLYVSVIIVSLITLYPYFAMFTTALKSRAEIYAMKGTILPIEWEWKNFTEIWNLAPLGRYFLNERIVNFLLNILDERVYFPHRNGAFFARLDYSVFKFVRVERLPYAAVFNDEHGGRFDGFVSGVSPAAFSTFSSAANGGAVVGLPRIYDFAFHVAAIHTFHISYLRRTSLKKPFFIFYHTFLFLQTIFTIFFIKRAIIDNNKLLCSYFCKFWRRLTTSP